MLLVCCFFGCIVENAETHSAGKFPENLPAAGQKCHFLALVVQKPSVSEQH
jgi:hypothetical protein